MSALQSLSIESISDNALVERLFQLATSGGQEKDGELRTLDEAVYSRLGEAYGESANREPACTGPLSIEQARHRAPETSPGTSMSTPPGRL